MPRASTAKTRLMDSAIELIWVNSYGSTTVDAICNKARVKKGSFYYFFPSKSELAVAALEADWSRKKPVLDAVFSRSVAPLDRFKNYFAMICERQAQMQRERGYVLGCPLFTLGSEIGTLDQAIRAKVEEVLARYLNYYEAAIRDAQAQGLIAVTEAHFKVKMVFAYVQGVLTKARIQNDLEVLRELYPGTMELLGAKPSAALAA